MTNKLVDQAVTIYNCVKGNGQFFSSVINIFTNYFVGFDMKNDTEFIKNSKIIGQNIWSCFYYGNTTKIFVNDIITPSLFLGNLLNDDERAALNMVADEAKREENEENKVMDSIDKDVIKSDIDEYEALCATIGIYFEKQLEDEFFYDIKSMTPDTKLVEFELNTNLFDNMDKDIKQYLVAIGRDLIVEDSTTFPRLNKKIRDALKSIFNQYMTYAKEQEAKDEKENAMLDQQIEKLKKKKEKLSLEPIDDEEEVTEDKMAGLGIKMYDMNKLSEYKVAAVKELRKEGITDDVIKKSRILREYGEKGEKPERKRIKELIKQTQETWGPQGTKYIELKSGVKVKNPFIKKDKISKKRKRKVIEEKNKANKKKKLNEKVIKKKEENANEEINMAEE